MGGGEWFHDMYFGGSCRCEGHHQSLGEGYRFSIFFPFYLFLLVIKSSLLALFFVNISLKKFDFQTLTVLSSSFSNAIIITKHMNP